MNYKSVIASKGYRHDFIASKLGISKTMMSLFLNNKRNLSSEKKRELHRLLDIK